MHEAANEHPVLDRFVLMLRVWHPLTTPVELRALQFIFDVCADPELVSSDKHLFAYERLVKDREQYYNNLLDDL